MYTFSIIMIVIASILLILAVLVQSPKSGMAANFGAANQTMGVRQTTDFLEKFTWAMIAAIVFFTLLSVIALPKSATTNEPIGTDAIAAGVQEVTNPVVEEIALGEEDIVDETAENAEAETEAVVEEAPATEEVAE